MTYQQTLDYIFSQLPMYQRVGKAAYKANLDNTILLDHYFKNPHKKFQTIHVAGTNGKGSVSHFLASILQEAGYKTGLYTSPHLLDFRERIKINGSPISETSVTDFFNEHKEIFEKIKPSFFEMTVALAFDYFASQQVDIAVIEVGLGGRLDSTNIISPVLSLITNISFDHTDLLGNTLEKIAAEKAGIIKENTPVIIGETQDEIKQIFLQKAADCNAPIYFSDNEFEVRIIKNDHQYLFFDAYFMSGTSQKKYENLKTELRGLYQKQNIQLVLKAVQILNKSGISIHEKSLINGLKSVVSNTGLMGRWHTLNEKPLMICDTGHNSSGIKHVVDQIRQTEYKKLHFVFGCVNDKDIDSVLILLPAEGIYYFCKSSVPRSLDENILLEKAETLNLKGNKYATVSIAISAAKLAAGDEDLIFIGGSTFVVADALKEF